MIGTAAGWREVGSGWAPAALGEMGPWGGGWEGIVCVETRRRVSWEMGDGTKKVFTGAG